MGLDDLVDDSKEEHKEKEVEKAADKIGVSNLEDLEAANEQLNTLRKIVIAQDSKIEEIDQIQQDIDDIRDQLQSLEHKIQVLAEALKDAD